LFSGAEKINRENRFELDAESGDAGLGEARGSRQEAKKNQ